MAFASAKKKGLPFEHAHACTNTHACCPCRSFAMLCHPGRLPDDGSFSLQSLTDASFPNDVCEVSLPLPSFLPNTVLISEAPHWLTAAGVIVPGAPFSILMDCTVILFARRTSVIALSSLFFYTAVVVSRFVRSSSSRPILEQKRAQPLFYFSLNDDVISLRCLSASSPYMWLTHQRRPDSLPRLIDEKISYWLVFITDVFAYIRLKTCIGEAGSCSVISLSVAFHLHVVVILVH